MKTPLQRSSLALRPRVRTSERRLSSMSRRCILLRFQCSENSKLVTIHHPPAWATAPLLFAVLEPVSGKRVGNSLTRPGAECWDRNPRSLRNVGDGSLKVPVRLYTATDITMQDPMKVNCSDVPRRVRPDRVRWAETGGLLFGGACLRRGPAALSRRLGD